MKRNLKVREQVVQKEKFVRSNFPQLLPKNQNQGILLDAFQYDQLVVAQGSAGTGKTYLSVWHAAKQLQSKKIKKVILIRAYQPLAGRSIGMLPGSASEKLMPFYQQLIDYFEDFLGKATTEIHLKNGTIEICSLETIRGRSWDDAIILIDEAQCLFVPEVQALVTRVGENAQIIFCGDDTGMQTDVKNGMNGLRYLRKLTEKYSISASSFINFTREDICRSGLTKEFVIAFEEEMLQDSKGTAIVSQLEQDKQFKKGR
jgi:phosphate starvation-inducible PhoH-like protein